MDNAAVVSTLVSCQIGLLLQYGHFVVGVPLFELAGGGGAHDAAPDDDYVEFIAKNGKIEPTRTGI